MEEFKIPVPSNILPSVSSPGKLSEYFGEQMKIIEDASKPVKLPTNLIIE
jgi:hypothetical protein